MRRPITPRIQVVEDLKDCIGKKVSTNISPTLRARLLKFNRDFSTFEVSEADENGPIKYNTAVGQIFEIPTHMAVTMNFI
jgi:hypothetical protein